MNETLKKSIEVMIEVTPECNFSCSGCFNKISFAKSSRIQKPMSTEYIKEIIDSCATAKIERIRFTGGEPLLRQDLPELIKYAFDKGLKVWLNTNATLITADFLKKTELYIDDVLVSINGYDDESDFSWTNTPLSFKRKIAGIKLLKQSKISYIRAGTVATYENILHLEQIYALVKRLLIDNWEVYRPIPISTKNKDTFDVKLLLKKLKKLSFDFGKKIKIANIVPFCADSPETLNEFSYGGIYDEGHSKIHVDPSGFAKPSYFINYNLGDPRDIMSCWNHSFMKQMRNLDLIPDECRICEYKQECKGGSRYISELFTGEINRLDVLANPCFMKYKLKTKIKISIIIPTFNNSLKLSYVLKALQYQSLDVNTFEVIIVDDGSTDNTSHIVKQLKLKLPFKITYVKHGGLVFKAGQARNLGAKYAKGEYLVFLNDDIIPMPHLLQEYLKQLSCVDVCIGYTAAYGSKNNLYENNIVYMAIDKGKNDFLTLPILSEFRSYKFEQSKQENTEINSEHWKLFTATNFAIKKAVFLQIGFNDKFVGWGVEDEEFAYRLSKQYKLMLCGNSIALHLTHDENLIELYTSEKILSMLNNFILFYQLHPVKEVAYYIMERYNHLPEKFKTEKIRKKLMICLNKR